MDEAFSLPSEEAVQIALRTQQLIAFESGVTSTVDPLGGSFYLEELTQEIETRAQAYIDKIDEMGGAVAAVEKGYIQREIQDSAYAYQKAIESGEQIVVGLNRFQEEEVPPKNLLRVDPAVMESQVAGLAELKAERDNVAVGAAIEKIKETARGTGNLVLPIMEAVRNYATLGEICDALREVFGEYIAVSTL
jgi:methylmalonyl-CoA mutase N-terminal domain/subunit